MRALSLASFSHLAFMFFSFRKCCRLYNTWKVLIHLIFEEYWYVSYLKSVDTFDKWEVFTLLILEKYLYFDTQMVLILLIFEKYWHSLIVSLIRLILLKIIDNLDRYLKSIDTWRVSLLKKYRLLKSIDVWNVLILCIDTGNALALEKYYYWKSMNTFNTCKALTLEKYRYWYLKSLGVWKILIYVPIVFIPLILKSIDIFDTWKVLILLEKSWCLKSIVTGMVLSVEKFWYRRSIVTWKVLIPLILKSIDIFDTYMESILTFGTCIMILILLLGIWKVLMPAEYCYWKVLLLEKYR